MAVKFHGEEKYSKYDRLELDNMVNPKSPKSSFSIAILLQMASMFLRKALEQLARLISKTTGLDFELI